MPELAPAATLTDYADIPTVIGNAAIATMAMQEIDLAPLWNALVKRATANPHDAGAFLDLSTIANIQGRPADRVQLRNHAFSLSRLFRKPAACDDDAAIHVLALLGPGEYLPNMPIEFLLEDSNVRLDMYYMQPGLGLPASLPDHHLLFVTLAECAENQDMLHDLVGLLRDWPRPVINRPELIAPLTRDGTWELLKSSPGLVIPINVAVTRPILEDLARGVRSVAELMPGEAFPIIARPYDTHLGDGLCKLDDIAAVRGYLAQRGESNFYIAPFIDYSSPDGLFRKYRVAMIDGVAYASHLAVSEHWMISYVGANMKENAAKRVDEERFMVEFDNDFAVRHADALRAISERTGLDYIPFDCAETQDGQLLLFELGTNMIVHDMDPADIFPYKKPQMAKFFAAFREMLARRAEPCVAVTDAPPLAGTP